MGSIPNYYRGDRNVFGDNRMFTTGQVAAMLTVCPRTVAKWIDKGKLPGYRMPGSKDRRVPRESLLRFIAEHKIPLPPELRNDTPPVGVGLSVKEAYSAGLTLVPDLFELGRLVEREELTLVVIGDEYGLATASSLAVQIVGVRPLCWVGVVAAEDAIVSDNYPWPVVKRPVESLVAWVNSFRRTDDGKDVVDSGL